MPAAIPSYVGNDFGDAPPGHRFRLYFDGWNERWAKPDEGWELEQPPGLRYGPSAQAALDALCSRQAEIAEGCDAFSFEASAATPFVTGLGMSHPTENGFAFLDPHGLPYLPGSSVKGVVRRAGEILALFEQGGPSDAKWTLARVWWLFGFDEHAPWISNRSSPWRDAYREHLANAVLEELEGMPGMPADREKRRQFLLETIAKGGSANAGVSVPRFRGALEFWDVFPQPPSGSMRAEVMTPHFVKWYRETRGAWPTDDDDPNPIQFLALPPKTRFKFWVTVRPRTLAQPALERCWRDLLHAAFAYVCEHEGLGAKRSVGYGRLEIQGSAATARRNSGGDEEHPTSPRPAQPLTPTQAMVLRLQTAPEHEVHEIFKQWAAMTDPAERTELARHLRAAYQRLGKWSGRQSEKQQSKNAEIKKVLGDDS